jgi:hypothetical protein
MWLAIFKVLLTVPQGVIEFLAASFGIVAVRAAMVLS